MRLQITITELYIGMGNLMKVLVIAALTFVVCSSQGNKIRVSTISKEWSNKQADIHFTLDSSLSVYINDYRVMADFVADMVDGMDISPAKTRVGVGIFSERFRQYLPLTNERSKSSLVDAIRDIPYVFGNGFLSRGLEGLRTSLSRNVTRKGVPHIAVIFTDGESRYRQLTIDNATLAKKDGIHLFTVGIGRDVDRRELRHLASDPKDNFAFWVPSFASLLAIKRQLMLNMAAVEFRQADETSCGKKEPADVLFLYDEYTMGYENSNIVKEFVESVVDELSVDSGNIRVGMISKTCHQGDIELGQYLTREKLISKMKDDDKRLGLTSLMRKARLEGFRSEIGGRPHAQKRVVLFVTKEAGKDIYRLVNEARRAKYNAVRMFLVDIDSNVMKGALEAMTSNASHITHVGSYYDLKQKKQDFMGIFCQGLN